MRENFIYTDTLPETKKDQIITVNITRYDAVFKWAYFSFLTRIFLTRTFFNTNFF